MLFLSKNFKKFLIGMFVINVFICITLFVLTFMSSYGTENFYKVISAFFNNSAAPFLMVAILPLTCSLSWDAEKRPMVTFFVSGSLLIFYVLSALPLSVEALIIGLMNIGGLGGSSRYSFAYHTIVNISGCGALFNFLVSIFLVFAKLKYKKDIKQ